MSVELPDWFLEEWGKDIHCFEAGDGTKAFPISGVCEMKRGCPWSSLLEDLQKVIRGTILKDITVVFLHDCCGVTKVEIDWETIRFFEDSWKEVDYIPHEHCYGEDHSARGKKIRETIDASMEAYRIANEKAQSTQATRQKSPQEIEDELVREGVITVDKTASDGSIKVTIIK